MFSYNLNDHPLPDPNAYRTIVGALQITIPRFTSLDLSFVVNQVCQFMAKGLVAELTAPHAQSAWGSRGERVRTAGLATCYNYLSQKKKSLPIYALMNCPTNTLSS